MKKSRIAACAALAFVALIVPASAGTYEDNVFPPGFPRHGTPQWSYENRNVHYGQHQNFGVVSGERRIIGRWRRITVIGGASAAPAPVVQERPVVYGPGRARLGNRVKTRGCSTCSQKPSARQDRNQSIVVKNVGKGANVTITATATQSIGGGGLAARSVGSSSIPASSGQVFHTVARVVGMQGGRFCFVDDRGVTSYTSRPHAVGAKFRVENGTMYWYD